MIQYQLFWIMSRNNHMLCMFTMFLEQLFTWGSGKSLHICDTLTRFQILKNHIKYISQYS